MVTKGINSTVFNFIKGFFDITQFTHDGIHCIQKLQHFYVNLDRSTSTLYICLKQVVDV